MHALWSDSRETYFSKSKSMCIGEWKRCRNTVIFCDIFEKSFFKSGKLSHHPTLQNEERISLCAKDHLVRSRALARLELKDILHHSWMVKWFSITKDLTLPDFFVWSVFLCGKMWEDFLKVEDLNTYLFTIFESFSVWLALYNIRITYVPGTYI